MFEKVFYKVITTKGLNIQKSTSSKTLNIRIRISANDEMNIINGLIVFTGQGEGTSGKTICCHCRTGTRIPEQTYIIVTSAKFFPKTAPILLAGHESILSQRWKRKQL